MCRSRVSLGGKFKRFIIVLLLQLSSYIDWRETTNIEKEGSIDRYGKDMAREDVSYSGHIGGRDCVFVVVELVRSFLFGNRTKK